MVMTANSDSVQAYRSKQHFTAGHIHRITDNAGDLIDIVTFCRDSCHRQYCTDTGAAYAGWDGCHEIYSPATCASCGQVWK